MTISFIDVKSAAEKIQQGAILVDIRQPNEYLREHIEGAQLQPLSQLEKEGLSGKALQAETIIFHCLSGQRTSKASQLLTALSGNKQAYILQGGLNGWKKENQPTKKDPTKPIDIMRQVQIVAGSLVLIGVLLGWTTNVAFYLLSGFVGTGLLFAGITGFCGMARLLDKMPWNKLN